MSIVLVSACLAGYPCRYDRTHRLNEKVRAMVREGLAVPICPEQLAGLGAPRMKIEFDSEGGGAAVLDGLGGAHFEDGTDCTVVLMRAADEVLRLAKLYGATGAVLKDGSPSCGVTYVYTGGRRVPGRGTAAERLRREGIEVRGVDTLQE